MKDNLVATVFVLAVIAALATGGLALARNGSGASQDPAVGAPANSLAVQNSAELQPLNEKQCVAARSMAEFALRDARERTAAEAQPALRAIESEYTSAVAWIGAGCPPDPQRGFVPNEEGTGGSLIIFTNQGFSLNGGTSKVGIPLIPIK